jgi:hypothetical protein
MFEAQSFVAKERILRSGSAVLGPEDREFTVVFTVTTFRTLTFTIQISTDGSGAAGLRPMMVTPEKTLIPLSTYDSTDVITKFKIGTFLLGDLYLALRVEPVGNSHVVTYTFSRVPAGS